MATRAEIIAAARKYSGTKFVHQGRSLKGLDCVGLILCVAEDLQLFCTSGKPLLGADYFNYGHEPAGHYVFEKCCERLIRKPVTDMKAGDVVVMRVPLTPTHVGILTEVHGQLGLMHAYSARGIEKVVEHGLDIQWRRRIVAAFEFPGTIE